MNKMKGTLAAILVFASITVDANNKIKVYFNTPVNTSVSTGTDAVYLNNCTADTIVAYINRAQYSLDIAQYDYIQGSFANIATAVNNAYSRGVKVRWIYDGSSSNSGLSLLTSGIHTLGSPTSSSYGIMHNKFMTIDASSSNANDAIVVTGSFDWSSEQFSSDHNNMIIFQDSALAHAYTAEFNMMWGDTSAVPNSTLAKFGPDKTDLDHHSFIIGGDTVELYFSPSDGTNTHIQSTISTADKDLYFGMYTFTDNTDATMIVSKHTSGVYVAGIDDSYSNSYSPYSTFTSGLGSNFKVYNGGSSSIYHNKYLVVDPSDACSNPMLLTGSHNWTTSANTKNDENTVIVHDATTANIYYQAFSQDFTSLSGTLTAITGCPTGVVAVTKDVENMLLAPNPCTNSATLTYTLATPQTVCVDVISMDGMVKVQGTAGVRSAGTHSMEIAGLAPGIYCVRIATENSVQTQKLIVE